MQTYGNVMEKLIHKKCYKNISKALSKHISAHPDMLELKYSRIKHPDCASMSCIELKFVMNVSIIGDTITFDAVMSCGIELEEETDYGTIYDTASQWFRVKCSVTVKDKIRGFAVHLIDIYTKKPPEKRIGAVTNDLVPIIGKEDLEAEATRFLEEYCPKALKRAMPIPIDKIIKDKMGLDLIKGVRLTNDSSVFGQICFSGGKIDAYDASGAEDEIKVERATIMVDESAFWEGNIGCENNTKIHEAFHWHCHRVYAAVKRVLDGEKFVACRCPVKSKKKTPESEWTDKDWIEWQASQVTPRIAMPIQTVKRKIKALYKKYGYNNNILNFRTSKSTFNPCKIKVLSK